MLTPMTPAELDRHKAMGLYKTQAEMEKDFERLRGRPLYTPFGKGAMARHVAQPGPVEIMGITNAPLQRVEPDILTQVEFEIQAHDD